MLINVSNTAISRKKNPTDLIKKEIQSLNFGDKMKILKKNEL